MNRVLLNNVDHADLRVAIRAGAAFGDSVNQLPIFPSEFEEAQRAFPIVFREEGGAIQPYALLGLDRDENLFLDGDRWTSAYVPVFQRRGPFSIALKGAGGDGDGEPMVHIDLDDPRVGDPDGLPLFKEHGGNAPLLDHITGVLRTIYGGMETVGEVCAAWREAGLLQAITLQIALDDGVTYEVPDILVVDRQALADLTGDALERLHRRGLLEGAMLAAASLGNVQRLIALKSAQRAAA
ncbi:SapC family protein [Sphingomonas metalli]|uniref:SapC family protein n=1 Tax=Sphingomonas metalli TaxID=1779358 RepID=A0A916SX20_9SPHN|nr:SapC family protein [Sphingomonas metalli]GGB20853.1 SapC family protein [Sphingomonas metalli]